MILRYIPGGRDDDREKRDVEPGDAPEPPRDPPPEPGDPPPEPPRDPPPEPGDPPLQPFVAYSGAAQAQVWETHNTFVPNAQLRQSFHFLPMLLPI